MKLQSAIILLIALFCASCATDPSLTVTPDGCVMTTHKDPSTGTSFSAGACVDEEGKITRFTTQWVNAEGVTVRASRNVKTKITSFYYQNLEGVWVKWTAVSGIAIGAIPTVNVGEVTATITATK